MTEDQEKKAQELVEQHVKWFRDSIEPLNSNKLVFFNTLEQYLTSFMIHGFKHGIEYKQEEIAKTIELIETKVRTKLNNEFIKNCLI